MKEYLHLSNYRHQILKRLNDILIDVIIPKKIDNLPSYLFNEDFYTGCSVTFQKNKFKVMYGNRKQVERSKNYDTISEAMKNILYYLEFRQELFQPPYSKVNNLLQQIIIDENLKSNIDSHRLLFHQSINKYVIERMHFDNKDAFPEVKNTFFCDGFKCKVLHIMKRNKLFECNGSKCKLKQIPSTYTEEELSPFVKLDTSHGNGVAHIGECNAIIADPDYIDLLMGNYEFSSAVVVVVSLI